MKMKAKTKLQLNRQTLRRLTPGQTAAVAAALGGSPDPARCTATQQAGGCWITQLDTSCYVCGGSD